MKRGLILVLAMLLSLWLLLCSGCLQFRKPTIQAQRDFKKQEITLHAESITYSQERSVNLVWTGDSSKPLLCLLHGSPGSWTAFESYLQDSLLLRHYCLVAVDRPGFGYSDFGHPEPSLDSQAKATFYAMKKVFGSRPFYVAGHSLGGPLAIKMAMLDSSQIYGVVVMAGSVDPKLEPREFFRPTLKKRIFKYLIPKSIWVSNYEIEALMDELILMDDKWKGIVCPVLSIHGKDDTMVPIGNADYMATKFKQSPAQYRDIRLEGKNHFIPWNAMDTIRTELINFRKHEH